MNIRNTIQRNSLLGKRREVKNIPAFKVQQLMQILQLYRLPQICETMSLLDLPDRWDASVWAEKLDNLVVISKTTSKEDTSQSSDFLVDLYHFKEIARLFSLENMKKLKIEFGQFDTNDRGLNLEEFVLMILKIIPVEQPKHIPYIINGIQQLYKVITHKYRRTSITFDGFLSFYFIGQLVTSSYDNGDNDYMEEQGGPERKQQNSVAPKQFEALKKSKYGFFSSKTQDVVHHDYSIKTVVFSEEFQFILSLDEQSDYYRVYNSNNLRLQRCVSTDSPKHRVKPIRLLDIYWSSRWKTIGACCQDMSISFWTLSSKSEYCFKCDKYGIQLKIYFIEITQTWITVSQHNEIIEWRFINQIDSAKDEQGLMEKVKGSKKPNIRSEQTDDNREEVESTGPIFTHSSVAEGKVWGFKPQAKISFIKEIATIRKLMIATFNQQITVWNPLKHSVFVTIDIPSGFSSAHTLAFSSKTNLIFSAGFDQSMLIWALDEVNQDYNRIGKIEVSEAGVSISAIECFDEYGLLVTVDESGMMRCWDIEQWKIAYRFNLGCKIKNTISSIIRLEMGRFIVVTSRLHMFEFPTKHPRKVKSKFQPLALMPYDLLKTHLVVASEEEMFCFNINNSIVEQKFNLENSSIPPQMSLYFNSVLQDTIYAIDAQGYLVALDHKLEKSNIPQQAPKEQRKMEEPDTKKGFLLFDGAKVSGMQYHWTYDLLCVWTPSILKVFKGPARLISPISSEPAQELHPFQQIRQLTIVATKQEFLQAKILPERDIIGTLLKGGMLIFWSFATLERVGCLAITIEDQMVDLIDFHLNVDYNVVLVIDSFYNIYFMSHNNCKEFSCVLKLQHHSLLGDDVLYKNIAQRLFDSIYVHQVFPQEFADQITDFLRHQQSNQKERFVQELYQANTDLFYEHSNQDLGLLYKLKELEREKRFIQRSNENPDAAGYKSLRVLFQTAVHAIISALREQQKDGSKAFITQNFLVLAKKEMAQFVRGSVKSSFTYRPSEESRKFSSMTTNIKPTRRQAIITTKKEENKFQPPVLTMSYMYSLPFLLEHLFATYYLVSTNQKGQIVVLDLQEFLESSFSRLTSEYANKQVFSKIQMSILRQDITQVKQSVAASPIVIERTIDSFSQLGALGIRGVQVNAHDKCRVLETQVLYFHRRLYLFSFGADDNVLKAWDVRSIDAKLKIDIDPSLFGSINSYARVLQQFQDLQSNRSEDVTVAAEREQINAELQLQIATIKDMISVSKVVDENAASAAYAVYLEGEYVLPIESKIRWNLKEYNQTYRSKQMTQTITLLTKMLQRWQMANKHQQQVLELQIYHQQFEYQKRLVVKKMNTAQKQVKVQLEGKSQFYYQQIVEQDDSEVSSSSRQTSSDQQRVRSLTQHPHSVKTLHTEHIKQDSEDIRMPTQKTMSQQDDSRIIAIKSKPSKSKAPVDQHKKPFVPNMQDPDLKDLFMRYWESGVPGANLNHLKEKDHITLVRNAPPLDEQLKSFHNRTLELNKQLNTTFQTSEKLLAQKPILKKRHKYEVELIRKEPRNSGQPELLKINARARSTDKMKYLLKYKFNEVSQSQLDSVNSIIKTNISTRNDFNSCKSSDDDEPISKRTHYLKYFFDDLQKYETVNDEYFTNFKSDQVFTNEPRHHFIKKIDQMVLLAKNFNNPNFKIKKLPDSDRSHYFKRPKQSSPFRQESEYSF